LKVARESPERDLDDRIDSLFRRYKWLPEFAKRYAEFGIV
jgi:hypothetical protein